MIVAIAAPIVLVGGAFLAAEATKSNTFCGTSCHEMDPYYRTWQASTHAEFDCVRCHIPPGVWNYAKTKFFALREVWVHVTGKVAAPIVVTRRISNEVCSSCHANEQLRGPIALAKFTVDFTHASHAEGTMCIDCHARVVHTDVPGVPADPPQTMQACFTCHDGTSQPNECVYCHTTSPHPERGACGECHGLTSWTSDFNHPDPLTGKHGTILCQRCHAQATTTEIGPAVGCIDCHQPPHPLRVGTLNLQTCADCHVIVHWDPNTFDHPTSDCASCHDPGPLHDGIGTSCQDCHDQNVGWTPTTFRHQQVGEHVPSGEHPLACTACHKTTYASQTCTPCHAPGGPRGG